MSIMQCEGLIGPKTVAISNGNNPKWINLSMEIVALYVSVLTGKTKSTPYGSPRLHDLSRLLHRNHCPDGLILDSRQWIIVSCLVSYGQGSSRK